MRFAQNSTIYRLNQKFSPRSSFSRIVLRRPMPHGAKQREKARIGGKSLLIAQRSWCNASSVKVPEVSEAMVFEGRSIEGQRWSGYAKYPSLTNFVPDDVDQLYDSVIQAVGDGHFRSHLLKPKPPRTFTKNCRFLAGRAQLRRIGFGMRNA